MTKKDAPDWAKKIEEWGQRVEKECGGSKEDKKDKRGDYVGAIVMNVIFIYLWRWLPSHLPFLTDSFAAILPLFYISFTATIAANILFVIYDGRFFRGILKAALSLIGLAILFSLYYIFPFDFSAYHANWGLVLRIIFIVGIIGTMIATISELVKAIFGDKNN